MFGLGPTELIVILVIVVILFGARRLPEIGKGVGEAIKNFKKSTSEPSEIDVTPKKKNEEPEENASRTDSDKENKS
ncbi:MAG TPA: twin-arginine translocase TatA/TatE family subunit [Nitrospirae bacterium]|nr:twin-arginine translocase TatA/TatE family subunit [Nitrospirota bacterium]